MRNKNDVSLEGQSSSSSWDTQDSDLSLEEDFSELLANDPTPWKTTFAKSTGQTSAKKLTVQMRAAQAVELRKAGSSYREIALKLGYNSPSAAKGAIMGLLKEMLGEPAEELRYLESTRLDEIWYEVRDIFMEADSPLLRLYAADRLIKLSERRSKLLGLDAPVKVDLEVKVRQIAAALGMDEEEAVSDLRNITTYRGNGELPTYGREKSSLGNALEGQYSVLSTGLGVIRGK